MNLKILFTVLSVIAGLLAFFPYLIDVIKKRTKPHAFTWLIWGITQSTATAVLWIGGGGIGAISITIGSFLVFLVFFLSLRDGTNNITKSDIVALVFALIAILIWWILDNPLIAVWLVAAIDLLGYYPTFRKSYSHPWKETLSSWITWPIANLFTILALENYNLLTLSYIVPILITNVSLVIFLLIRRRKVDKP